MDCWGDEVVKGCCCFDQKAECWGDDVEIECGCFWHFLCCCWIRCRGRVCSCGAAASWEDRSNKIIRKPIGGNECKWAKTLAMKWHLSLYINLTTCSKTLWQLCSNCYVMPIAKAKARFLLRILDGSVTSSELIAWDSVDWIALIQIWFSSNLINTILSILSWPYWSWKASIPLTASPDQKAVHEELVFFPNELTCEWWNQ